MTSVEVTFLGTTAAVPTRTRNHPSVHLLYRSENEFQFLFDCGEGTQKQMMSSGINFMRVNQIFISHWHADHFAGLLGLLETMNLEGRKETLTIYGPEAEKFVPQLLDLGYGSKKFFVKWRDVEFEGSRISNIFETPEFYIMSSPMSHSIPAVAYAFVEKDRVKIDKTKAKELGMPEKGPIFRQLKEDGEVIFKGKKISLDQVSFRESGKKIVYSGDTKVCPNMHVFAKNADLLIHDATFFGERDDFEKDIKHATVDEVLELSRAAAIKQTVLTHISRRYQNLSELEEKISNEKNVKIAKDLMKIVIQ